MKNLKLLVLMPSMLLAMHISFAQGTSRLKLSNPYPERNEKITFTYDAPAELIKPNGKIEGTVWFVEDTGPSKPLTIEGTGDNLKGEITISAGARAFFIKVNNRSTIDNNNGKGYIYPIYKDKQPIEGAFALSAVIITSGLGSQYAKIERNTDTAAALFRKEFELYPQSEKRYGATYYSLLAANPANAAIVNKKIAELQATGEENDYGLAINLLNTTGQKASADSVKKVAKAKFPMGRLAMGDDMLILSKENDFAKKDSLFKSLLVKYQDAPANMKESMIYNMLGSYLKNGDIKNYDKYAAMVSNKEMLIQVLNSTAWNWAVAGEKLAEAEKLSKQSIDIMLANAGVVSPTALTKENGGLFSMIGDTYAYILWKEGKFDEAVKTQSIVYARGADNAEIVEHYVQMLNSAKDYKTALDVSEKSIRAGKTSAIIEEGFKTAYQNVKGGMAGYDAYWADVQKANNAKKEKEKQQFEAQQKELLANANSTSNLQDVARLKKELSGKMIKETAPLFSLKDLDGKTVSLESLKGKTVVIDFWATWCGPCIQSFPGMQIAQNKYKSDPNIVFLFIDTWENGTDYLPGVKKFIADKSYSFHVLMDEMGADKRQSKVVSSYKVEGIPTKFIIDKNGDIRFKYVGYSGSTEGVVNEVTAMIEMLNDPAYKNATPGTSVKDISTPAPPKPTLNK